MFYLLSIMFLAIFDMVATHYLIIVHNTYAIEANPLMRWIMEEYGIPIAYVFKILVTLASVITLLVVKNIYKKTYANYFLFSVLIIHILLMCWHVYNTKFFTAHW
jgi:hypothetical protein